MTKEVKKIFIFLIIYACAAAFLFGFQELWMSEIGLSTKTISIVYSLCALLTVSVIFLCTNLVNRKRLKNFILALVLLRMFTNLSLFFLHGTNLKILIKWIIMLDYVANIEIESCIYPLITLVTMDNAIYAKKDIYYNGAWYIITLLFTFLIGKKILFINISYNFCVLLAAILLFISYLILKGFKPSKAAKGAKNEPVFGQLMKFIKKDKVTQLYFVYCIFNQFSYNTIAGIIITFLTAGLSIANNTALLINTISCVLAVFIGAIVLKWLTFKNDKVNLFLKYGVRNILYVLAFITNNRICILAAILFTLLSSVAYSHITDGTYVNRIDENSQFAFCNLRSMLIYFGKSIGTLISGISIGLGNRYVFLFAGVFCLIQNMLIFKAATLKEKENVNN